MNIKILKKLILLGFAIVFLVSEFAPIEAATGSNAATINQNAFVYILNVGIEGMKLRFNGLRNAFAVGNGQYILTAAHCVADFENTNEMLCQPLVISPYYGDLFEAEIVAVDDVNDIAILKPTWNTHPALELETSDTWKNSKTISITGYPPIDQEKGGNGKNNSRDIKIETVELVNSNGRANHTIMLGPVHYAAEGWSGSAFIIPETGKVAGITCLKHLEQKSLKIKIFRSFKIPLSGKNRYISGCNAESINSLFQTHQLTYGTPKTSFPDSGGKHRFDHILSTLDPITESTEKQLAAGLENLCNELSNSYLPTIIMAAGVEYSNFISSMEKTVEIAPESNFVHAAYGNYLLSHNKPQKAVEQFQFVTEREPNHLFACHGLLSALVKSDPNAAEVLGRELTARWPDNAGFCFEYSKALRAKNKGSEELPVIQKAVELCDQDDVPYPYLRYLADSLEANKHYEQAEETYIKLFEKHECDRCWWAYTLLLLEMGPDRSEQAKHAFDKTLSFIQDPNDIAEKQRRYETESKIMPSEPNVPTPSAIEASAI